MSIDDELLLDEQETQREMKFIREQLPIDSKDNYADDELLSWVIEVIAEYYFESGVLESQADEIDIDMQQVADAITAQAKKDGQGTFDPAEVVYVVEADMDFQEQNL